MDFISNCVYKVELYGIAKIWLFFTYKNKLIKTIHIKTIHIVPPHTLAIPT